MEDFIKVGEASIYYKYISRHLLEEGRPLLVFLHEGLGSISQWKDFPMLLSEKVDCPAFLFDREGYGKSSMLKKKNDWDYLNIQAQQALPKLFHQLKLEEIKKILIGHSDGGSIAIIHAGTFPDNIIGVITEASHQFIENVSVDGIKKAVKAYESGKLKELLRKYHADNTDTMFHGWADTWLREGFQQWSIEEYLKKIKIPFLGIQGQDDQYGTFAQLESIKKNVVNSEICFLPECGHNPHLQHKKKLVEIMSEFISRLL